MRMERRLWVLVVPVIKRWHNRNKIGICLRLGLRIGIIIKVWHKGKYNRGKYNKVKCNKSNKGNKSKGLMRRKMKMKRLKVEGLECKIGEFVTCEVYYGFFGKEILINFDN
eukprot:UN12517